MDNTQETVKIRRLATELVLLGTGNPNPDPVHQGPAILIMVDGTPYLVDFGPGIVRQAAALMTEYGGLLENFHVNKLNTVFLTHLHSDHTAGYPDLILTPWIMGRASPLEVYGPQEIRRLTKYVLRAYRDDINYRVNGTEPTNDLGWRVNVHEISEGVVFSDARITVEAFRVKHGSWPDAFGFRFNTPDKVIVISGDTAPCDNILQYGKDADILVHEVYSRAAFELKNKPWQEYHSGHHTSTEELAHIARVTSPGLLILNHVLFWGATEDEILAEIRKGYKGQVEFGKDLQIIG